MIHCLLTYPKTGRVRLPAVPVIIGLAAALLSAATHASAASATPAAGPNVLPRDTLQAAIADASPNCAAKPNGAPEVVARFRMAGIPGAGALRERDPDWEERLRAAAASAVTDGTWARAVERMQADWVRRADAPQGLHYPMRHTSAIESSPTPLAAMMSARRKAGLPATLTPSVRGALEGVERLYWLVDARNLEQRLSTVRLFALAREGDAGLPASRIVPVLVNGSRTALSDELARGLPEDARRPARLYFDQGGTLARALGVRTVPTLAIVSATRITRWSPALSRDGDFLDGIPAAVAKALGAHEANKEP